MPASTLTIDLNALTGNWRALDALSATGTETAAVVKADAYGLGVAGTCPALHRAGVRSFFTALTQEAVSVRQAVGQDADIYSFSGYSPTTATDLKQHNLIPVLSAPEHVQDFLDAGSPQPFAVQLDTGMNRMGLEPAEFAALKDRILAAKPALILSHLACADEPEHPQNAAQLRAFKGMTDDLVGLRRSLAATGGTILGPEYQFDLCRTGIGIYGGAPFEAASPVVTVSIPVLQIRDVAVGESVGYGAAWVAERPTKLATIAAGYADGLIRAMCFGNVSLFANGSACPLVGRVSMDLITVDITDLDHRPEALEILNATQTVDILANQAGTIGYEILTSLGGRYNRVYVDGQSNTGTP
jgi:alanine racemase